MPKEIFKETLCCNMKRCPTVTAFDDGSVEITDDDTEGGSVGTIKFNSEQFDKLLELAEKRKK